jgi:hypothetical protein
MKAVKGNEKTVTTTYREIEINLSGLKTDPEDWNDCDEMNMSVRIHEDGQTDVLCDGMIIESGGSGDDRFHDDWLRYHNLVLALVGSIEVDEFLECYGNPWSYNQMRGMFKEWVKEYPEFLDEDIKKFIEEEDDVEDEFDEDSY